MKSGRTLVSLAQELERQLHSKKDLIVPSQLVHHSTGDDGQTHIIVNEAGNPVRYGVTPLARRQLADKLKIPHAYFERMREEQPVLLDRNVNTWLQSEDDRRMLRTLDGQVRAVLSDRYRRLDNFDLAESVLPILQQLPDVRFESVELTETRMYLKCITSRLTYEMAPGDVVQAGVVISNSEVGQGTLSVQPLLYRLVCRNGLIAADRSLRKTHVGRSLGTEDEGLQVYQDDTLRADDKAFFLKVRDVVQAAVSEASFRQTAQKLQKTLKIPLVGEDGRGAGPALHAQRCRALGRAAASDHRGRALGLRAGQCGDALQPGDRRLRPRHGVRGAGRQADRARHRRVEGPGRSDLSTA